MRKSRFTEKQISNILKSGEAGPKVNDACRPHGIEARESKPLGSTNLSGLPRQ